MKAEEITKEIQDAFQARPRATHVLRPSVGNDDEMSNVQRLLSTNRVKASRTQLPFSNIFEESIVCCCKKTAVKETNLHLTEPKFCKVTSEF